MPYPAFPTLGMGPNGPIATSSSRSTKPAVLTAKFGGRYSQRTGDGINALPSDVAFVSPMLPAVQIKELHDFLLGRKGYLPFVYLVPYETVPRQFICSSWDADFSKPGLTKLTATFEENFDP